MSFFLFTLYIALNFVRPVELLAPELGAYRPMLWLWLIAFAAACVEALQQRRVAASSLHFLLLGGLMLAIAASQLKQGWLGGAIGSVANFSTSSMLFVLATLNLTSSKRLEATGKVLAASIVAMALLGIVSYHTGWNVDKLVLAQNSYDETLDPDIGPEAGTAPAQDTSGKYLWRLHALGFLQDPNDFAQAMIVSLPLLLLGYRAGRRLRNAVVIGLPAAALLYAIQLTHSRGALVALAAMLFFGARRTLGLFKTAMLGVVLAVASLAMSFGGGREFSTQEQSAGDRIDAWYAGFMMFKSSPLFGIGYGNFTDHHDLTAHNSFVLCLAELGLFGYVFWVGMIVIAFIGLQRARQKLAVQPAGVPTPELLFLAMVGFLACAWFLSRTYQPTLYLLLALCASAWYCAVNEEPVAAGQGTAVLRARAMLQSPWRWPWLRYTVVSMFASVALVQSFVVASRMSAGG